MPGELEKAIWSDDDYERMGWHDASIHAWGAIVDEYELVFDLDYIVEWVHPRADEKYFSFWVAPVTLVFASVSDVRVALDSPSGEITLQALRREDPRTTPTGLHDHRWILDANEGSIAFRATGFRQYFRRAPVLTPTQCLLQQARGGLSFDRPQLSLDQLRPRHSCAEGPEQR